MKFNLVLTLVIVGSALALCAPLLFVPWAIAPLQECANGETQKPASFWFPYAAGFAAAYAVAFVVFLILLWRAPEVVEENSSGPTQEGRARIDENETRQM
ncbi:MAG: hypothetical protein AB1490_12355 [Pseudomonadota bacterium]